jgi:peptide/nickel transport system substrate-binding protein
VSSRTKVSRRSVLEAGAVAAAGLLATACQSAPATPTSAAAPKPAATVAPPPTVPPSSAQLAVTATPASARAGAATPKSGGALTMAQKADISNFDPFYLVQNNSFMHGALYDSLITYDDKMNPIPRLAESWELAKDGQSIQIKLRKGTSFHGGREVEASDVAFSIGYVQDKKHGSQLIDLFAPVTKVDTPDKYTLVLTFNRPYPAVFDMLNFLYVLDKDGAENLKAKPAGTGPFVFDSWEPGNQLVVTKNKSYWESGKPYLDKLVMRAIPDQSSMVASVRSGGVDLIWNFQLSQYVELQKDDKLKVDPGLIGATYYDMTFNVTRDPVKNKLVRQAINYATDREQFVKSVLYGVSQPTNLPFPTYSIAYSKELDQHYTYDLDKAKALLKQAGMESLSFTAIASSQIQPESVALAQIIQASLKQIGVNMTVQNLEAARYLDLDHKSDFQMMMHTFGRSNTDPDTLLRGAIVWRAKDNVSKFDSADYAKLVDQAGSTVDPEKRKALYQQVAAIIVDECWTIPVAAAPLPYAYTKKLQGFAYDRQGDVVPANMWLAA